MWRSAVQVCLGLLVSQVISYLSPLTSYLYFGGLAQLARAPALQAGGQRFESVILHGMENGRIKEWKNWSLQSFNFSIFQFFTEIFDILTHKTVSKDFKLLTECFYNNSQFTAESMSYKELKNYRIEELKTSIFQSFNFSILLIWRKKVRASGGCLGSRRRWRTW